VCGGRWEIADHSAAAVLSAFAAADGFEVNLAHMTVVGRCRACRDARAGR
jgi:Fe2+ or Zn2+ uptake regulation protein